MSRTREDELVLVGAARTPQGRLRGQLAPVPATELGTIALRGALAQAEVDPRVVDAVVMGHVLQAGAGQNPARQAALRAGLDGAARAVTVNTVCLSGLTAIIEAARWLRLGEAEVVVAGGMESMTRAPHLLPGSRAGFAFGDVGLLDHARHDGLTDAFDGVAMGELTERSIAGRPVGRVLQDAVAARSHRRAARARADGTLRAEIVPVQVPHRRGEPLVADDEGVRPESTGDTLARLAPAFHPDGTITAGNASPLSDGAAAVVLTTRARAEAEAWPVLASLRAHAEVAGPDNTLLEQPARALTAALTSEGWTTDQLSTIEINEAFAAVVAASAHALGIDPADPRLNTDGGGIALGHPLGASGARLVVHAAHTLRRVGGRAGVALCGGGGQGAALLLDG
ncbi:acetyl-CoA C-acyltransferase [Cellulosimicrobium sp. Marseille-Q4280]|uniref:acetyl-CoA C-acyltransferase n=1 Tax=Cellulosimicrobium sp. Marseille-Q4280 TaxID=2937992 RepID=UPI00203CAC88|nr:acetyl-CoA C-acyltransferase [Cellulosimicrobium sp. Marseille-Q4280]